MNEPTKNKCCFTYPVPGVLEASVVIMGFRPSFFRFLAGPEEPFVAAGAAACPPPVTGAGCAADSLRGCCAPFISRYVWWDATRW